MKKFKALRMSMLFVLIIFVSCNPKDGGASGVGPGDPPPSVLPKIESFTPDSSPFAVILTGKSEDANVVFSWKTINGSSNTFDGTGVNANDSKTVSVTTSKDFILRVVGTTTVESTKNVVESLHPMLEKLVGASTGKKWRLISIWGRPIGSTGAFTELIDECQKTYVYTFSRDLSSRLDRGVCAGGVSKSAMFRLDVSTGKILDSLSSTTLLQDVSFNASATVMEFASEVSGSGGWNIRRIYNVE